MINTEKSLKESIHNLLLEIVEDASQLSIEEKIGENSSAISIMTNKKDTGKIIGKLGNTIKSLRIIARAMGSKRGIRCNLYVID